MSSPRRRGRRVPPKGDGARPAPQPGAQSGAPGAGSGAAGAAPGSTPGSTPGSEAGTSLTRAQNRAAKRATSGVRAKRVVRGRVTGRQSRGYNPAVIGLVAVAALVVAGVFLVGNPFGGAAPSASPEVSPTPAATRALTGCPTAAPAPLAAGEKRTITIETAKGNIVIEVDAALAPLAAANFVALAECGYYDGVIFHRVVPDFVIQGGDGQYGWIGALDRPKAGQGGPGYEFADETVVGDYIRGAVAMANSGPNTNGSQFFICTADLTGRLGKDYTIFGRVTSGMEVVDQIVSAPRNAEDFPDDPVAMDSVAVAPAPTTSPSPAASGAATEAPTSSPAATP